MIHLAILRRIFGNCQTKIKVQQTAAAASETPSAAYTPIPPIQRGNSRANGTNNITLRNKAMKTDTLAWPSATNMFWQARCRPKIVIPARNTGKVCSTVAISRSSDVKP